MQAGLREVHRFGVGKLADLEGLHPIEEGSRRIGPVRILIDHRPGAARSVPFLAGSHAGLAAYADIEIDYQGQLRHFGLTPRNARMLLRVFIPG